MPISQGGWTYAAFNGFSSPGSVGSVSDGLDYGIAAAGALTRPEVPRWNDVCQAGAALFLGMRGPGPQAFPGALTALCRATAGLTPKELGTRTLGRLSSGKVGAGP